ncbi:DUF2125 domain-containing protein [Phaeobacter sp. QD34_3]|uniref:DUF2125 domain-containing protein n=1 Tax=unclassified Phaeobacter TaxID=2621772 RepID=UPI00237F8AA6|nr:MULTISPECIES: DUF2125 domain-containing protein [unclassified Phaeobacter]MDE4132324.1 DUF2125 domain-containing protein [Phaeobacter sp. QD34_3]MDE4135962.1 DUF2125 domain-containing protein [Phaeobacter sp. QD34_24]
MSVFLSRSCCTAIVLIASAQGALADLSAQDVWSDWKSYMSGVGYEMTATENQSGNMLTVSDLSMIVPIPDEDDVTAAITMDEITFTENGDGTVSILLPKDFPMTVLASEGNDKVTVGLLFTHDGSPIMVSGDPSNMAYDYATSQMTMTLDKLEATGEDIPQDAIRLTATLSDVVTKTTMSLAGNRTYDQSWTASALSYDLGFKDPGSEDHLSAAGAMQQITTHSVSTLPSDLGTSGDFSALLAAGFSAVADFSYTSGNSAISFKDGRDSFAFDSTSGGGAFDVTMDASKLSYGITHKDMAFNVAGSEIPFPLALSMAEAGFNITIPVAKSEAEQDFALGVALRDFAVPEMLWGMIDPSGALPHDPASVVLSLTGKGKVLFDIFDPEAMEKVEDGDIAPGELNAVSINELLVSAAGAKLTGTGDFTFNNEDLASFDGLPAPSGEANLSLSGANSLVDKLVGMGLLSDEDAMGARMMMGMLAVPGEGEDTLNSKIEITEDGKILANGQRLK